MKMLKKVLVLLIAAAILGISYLLNLSDDTEDPSDPVVTVEPSSAPETADPEPTEDPSETYEIYEDGIYDTKEEVALYLYTFHKLPSNYMTKTEARKEGWESGALNQVVPGMCIGGDYYGNYEGVLPEDAEYHECDIDTINSKSRGAKRIVYSDTWDIYYTEDHYETFELLYSGEE